MRLEKKANKKANKNNKLKKCKYKQVKNICTFMECVIF